MNSIIFSILFLLLEKRKVSRTFLCEKFEISPRSVSRYVDALVECDIPVLSAPGKGGGYMLPDDYILERTFFTDNERKRIISLLNATAKNYEDDINMSIIEKFNSFKDQAKDMALNDNRLIIDAGPWGSPHIYKNKIDIINKSMNLKQTLRFKYTDRNEIFSERFIDAYNLVLKQGVWYVYGWCHEREDYRLFKLSRMANMILTSKTYSLRPDADVYEKLKGQFDTQNEVDFVIEFSNLVLPQIEEWLGPDAIYEDGLMYRARATLYGGNELVAKILSFGSSIKVISPAALKEEVLIECRRVLEYD